MMSLCATSTASVSHLLYVAEMMAWRGPYFLFPRGVCDRHQTDFRVLVVDDNRDSTDSLAMLMNAWGHAVRETYTGADALAIFPLFLPDIMVIDLEMPEMNGLEVARQARRLAGRSPLTLVAMTGHGTERDYQLTRKAGFDHHLVKPADLSLLQSLMDDARDRCEDDACSTPEPATFSERLRQRRVHAGRHSYDVATETGMRLSAYLALEAGETEPTLAVACKLADALGGSIDDFCLSADRQ